MKKGNISKYIKLAIVLLIDTLPVWFAIRVATADDDVGFNLGLPAFLLMVMFLVLLFFNLWALLMYSLTKSIKRLWLREVLFYLSLLLYFCFLALFITG